MPKKLTITFNYVTDYIDSVDENGKKKSTQIYTKTWKIEDGSFHIIESTPSILQFKTVDGAIIGYNLNDDINHYVIEDM